jgi:Domain of unknown function (DUF6089)
MRKILLPLLLISAGTLSAQNLHLFVTGGMMNYQGDLQPKRITFSQAHPYFGAGAYYELTDKLFIRASVIAGKVSASDALGKLNAIRNLSFASNILEFQLGGEYDIFNSYEHRVVPYIFAGVAGFHFNPYTKTSSGNTVYLQPLGTEGQGFFQGRKKYGLTQLSIPFGGGVKFAVNDNVYLRIEASLRKLFTDYLDDVSTFYIDKNVLFAANGQTAVDLAFRSDELNPLLPYPDQGSVRGNPKSKDYYYTAGITISFRINSGNGSNRPGKGKLGCPVNVY